MPASVLRPKIMLKDLRGSEDLFLVKKKKNKNTKLLKYFWSMVKNHPIKKRKKMINLNDINSYD